MASTTLQPGSAPANPLRRALLGALAVAPIAVAGAATDILQLPPLRPVSGLAAEIESFSELTRRMDGGGYSDAEWDAWLDQQRDIIRRVEALPETAENAPVRAKAIQMIMGNEGEPWGDYHPIDRLGRSLVRTLAHIQTGEA